MTNTIFPALPTNHVVGAGDPAADMNNHAGVINDMGDAVAADRHLLALSGTYDFNDIALGTWFAYPAAAANKPAAVSGTCLVEVWDAVTGVFKIQRATDFEAGKIWTRFYVDGAGWQPWLAV